MKKFALLHLPLLAFLTWKISKFGDSIGGRASLGTLELLDALQVMPEDGEACAELWLILVLLVVLDHELPKWRQRIQFLQR